MNHGARQLALPLAEPAPPTKEVSVVVEEDLEQLDGRGDDEAHRMRVAGFLTMRMPDPVDVVFTDNRSTMLSHARRGGRIRLRLHRIFRHADETMLDHVARYVARADRSASRAIDAFVAAHRDEVRRERRPRPSPRTAGEHHDLEAAFTAVNEAYFGGEAAVRIGWGRAPGKRRRRRAGARSRALATYSFEDRCVRLSPILDSPRVPRFVIEWVVYHELLHHVLPVEESGGRRRYHTSRFRALERAFARYEEAKAWEEDNAEWLTR